MKKVAIAFVILIIVFAMISIPILIWGIGIRNELVGLETQFSAQVQNNKVLYDEVTKIIFGKANVSQKYSDDFKNIYVGIMDARYGKTDKVLMNWIQEKNPDYDITLYKELNQSIEVERLKFTKVQEKQIDIKREHDNLRLKFPGNIVSIVFGFKELELKLVTSTRVEKSFETGKDDNADPFKY